MAAIGDDLPTLVDFAKRMDPSGAIAQVVEMLAVRTPILMDAVFQEGNLPTGHRFTSRKALPSVTWRRFNEGVATSKSRTDQVDETCGMLEALSQVDVELAKLNGNGAAFRASEDRAFLIAMKKEVETGFVYHSTKTDPERFHGFAARLDATSGNPASSQIIKHTGSPSGADQTSIWLVNWSPDTVHGIFPKGSIAGLSQEDKGEQLVEDANSKKFFAFMTKWVWKLGLCVKDWRHLVRICNIDTSALSKTADDIVPTMIDAYHQLEDPNMGRQAWYCNRFIGAMLHHQARAAAKPATLTIEEVGGKPVVKVLGIPVRITDAITKTEAAVT